MSESTMQMTSYEVSKTIVTQIAILGQFLFSMIVDHLHPLLSKFQNGSLDQNLHGQYILLAIPGI